MTRQERWNESGDLLREELGSTAGAAPAIGGFTEMPASYLQCPGGACREQEEPSGTRRDVRR